MNDIQIEQVIRMLDNITQSLCLLVDAVERVESRLVISPEDRAEFERQRRQAHAVFRVTR